MSLTETPAQVGVPVLVVVTLVSILLAVLAVTENVTPETVSVLTSLLLIVVTATYAYLTYGLLLESRESRRRESAPILTVVTDKFDVVPELSNVGNGPARRVEVTLRAHSEGEVIEQTGLSIGNLGVNQSYILREEPFSKLIDEEEEFHEQWDTFTVSGQMTDAFGDVVPVELRYEPDQIGSAPSVSRGPTESALERVAVELERLREADN